MIPWVAVSCMNQNVHIFSFHLIQKLQILHEKLHFYDRFEQISVIMLEYLYFVINIYIVSMFAVLLKVNMYYYTHKTHMIQHTNKYDVVFITLPTFQKQYHKGCFIYISTCCDLFQKNGYYFFTLTTSFLYYNYY